MTLAQTAYRNMLIAQVKVGKLTPKKATQLFNRYMEACEMERFVKILEHKPKGFFAHEILWYDNYCDRYCWLEKHRDPEFNGGMFWKDGYDSLEAATRFCVEHNIEWA